MMAENDAGLARELATLVRVEQKLAATRRALAAVWPIRESLRELCEDYTDYWRDDLDEVWRQLQMADAEYRAALEAARAAVLSIDPSDVDSIVALVIYEEEASHRYEAEYITDPEVLRTRLLHALLRRAGASDPSGMPSVRAIPHCPICGLEALDIAGEPDLWERVNHHLTTGDLGCETAVRPPKPEEGIDRCLTATRG